MKTTILKNIAITAICLFSMNSYAQTKEETISWVKEKLDKCVGYSNDLGVFKNDELHTMNYSGTNGKPANKIEIILVNECNIEIRLLVKTPDDSKELIPVTFVLPINGIKIIQDGFFLYSSKKAYYTVREKEYYTNFIYDVYIQNKEDNIYERLQIALDHLATFCPKKKETF